MRGRRVAAIAVASVFAETALVARRRGSLLALDTVVRCRRGHLFTTIWVPGASVKALRLGWWRFQRCPAGGHWSLVAPVAAAALSEEERRRARHCRDLRLP